MIKDMEDWDYEFNMVARETAALRQAFDRGAATGRRNLVNRKVSIVQAEINLRRSLDRIKKLLERDFLLLPGEKAMVHWAGAFVTACEKVHETRTKSLIRALWLKLIRCRIDTADGKPSGDIDAEDLVGLSLRHNQLLRTEKFLTEAVAGLRKKKKELHRRYEQLGIVEANHHAARSLRSRLGVNVRDAMDSPEFRALSSYVSGASRAARGLDDTDRAARATERHLAKTGGLLEICRNMILSRLSGAERRPDHRTLDKFELAMQQLNDLESDTQAGFEAFWGDLPESARPILVQKSAKNATTDPAG